MATENPAPLPSDDAPPAPEPSLRDTLEQAFDDAHDSAAAPADAPAPAAPLDADGNAPSRDDRGRFAPKAGAAPAEPAAPVLDAQRPAAPAQPGTPMPPAPTPELRPPVSWKPQAREKWATVDAEIKAEVVRREAEHQHTLQQSAQARQFQDAFERVVRPYEVFIRAENSTPLDAVDNLMRMAAVMRTGSPSDKVNVVANIIRQWSIDLPMLDGVMAAHVSGQPAPQFAQQQAFRDPRLDQLLAAQHQQLQQAQRDTEAGLTHDIATFEANPKNEFFHDVRPVMADLIHVAAMRGQAMTLDDAYAKACQLDDNVSKILAQRASARQAGTNTNAALRARRAAASVRGDTTLSDGATVPRDESVRASLEAAFEESERRTR